MTDDDMDLLAFVRRQSYGKSVDATRLVRPPIVREDDTPITIAGTPFWTRVEAWLARTFSPLRHEPHGDHGPHRAYPSARALFPVDVCWLTDATAYRYDPVRRGFVGRTAADVVAPASAARFCLLGRHDGVPAGYGDLRYALTVCEAGHMLRAAARGLATRVCLDFDDRALLGALGLATDGRAAPLALLDVGPAGPEHVERATWQRSSGRGPSGLSASLRPMPRSVLADVVSDAFAPLPGGPPLCRVLVASARVEGLADGLHELSGNHLQLRRAGAVVAEAQEAFTYPATAVNVASMNLVVWLVIEPAALVADGPRGLRRGFLELGWLGQGLAEAVAPAGYFARPTRSYHEHVLDRLLALPPGEQVAYQLLVGKSRFVDAPLAPLGGP